MFGIFKPKHKIGGMEFSGVIESVDKAVAHLSIGDAVYGDISEFGFGGFAEYCRIDENALRIKYEFMSFSGADVIPHAALLAARNLIDLGEIKANTKVLVNSAGGGEGAFALQIAKHYGAEVTGVDTVDKLVYSKTMGYDNVIDYKANDFTTLNLDYDLIFDTENTRLPMQVIRALKRNIEYISIGGDLFRLIQIAILKPLPHRIFNKYITGLSLKINNSLIKIVQLYEKGALKLIIDGPIH